MHFFYPTPGALLILVVFLVLVGRQHRDLLRVRAYSEFFVRLLPLLSTGVLVLGLPVVMGYTTEENVFPVLLVYLGGTAILTVLMARRPLPRYYSALGACLGVSGNPRGALEATSQAIKLDPKLGVAYYNRASALVALDERDRARDDLRTVFRVDSNRRLKRAAEQALASLEKS